MKMLPNTTAVTSSIHINPKFRNVHINPIFFGKSNGNNVNNSSISAAANIPTHIYINPKFLNSQIQSTAGPQSPIKSTSYIVNSENAEPLADTKVHTRKKIINSSKPSSIAMPNKSSVINGTKPLIKINSKKLMRVAEPKPTSFGIGKSSKVIAKVRRPIQTKYKIVKEQTAFKIDRRSQLAKEKALLARKTSSMNSIRKLCINESLVPLKTVKRYCTSKIITCSRF